MTMVLAWLVFPLVLALLSLGCGLLVERLSAVPVPGPLVVPAGFALIIVAGQFTTLVDATAELTVPLVVVLALAGLFVGLPWRRTVDAGAVAAAVAVLAVYAAPIVLSGSATVAGYLKIEDTVIWLSLTDHVMEHGRDVSDLPPSSYEAIIDGVMAEDGYPIGVFMPLGVGRALVGQDLAWLIQPYFAFLAALLALCLYYVAGRLVESRAVRALFAFVAAQAALLFAYSLFGGIKELAAAALLALLAALVPIALERDAGARRLVPLALTSSAVLGIWSVAGAVWLLPALLAALVAAVRLRGRSQGLRLAVGFAVLVALFSIPPLLSAADFLAPGSDTLTSESERGNLIGALSVRQAFGIWPAGDFRVDPSSSGLANLLIAVAFVAAVVGAIWLFRRRAWTPLLYVASSVAAALLVLALGSPWVDGKALAVVAPALVLAALLGGAALAARIPPAGAAVVVAVAAGVLWSNVLAYGEVDLAPHDRLDELKEVGERLDDRGPVLTTEYEYYGVRHFLRDAAPEGASLLGRRADRLQGGQPPEEATFADIDQFQLAGLVRYRALVLRRSPLASRPPLPFRLTWSGRYYEIWERQGADFTAIRAHLSLGEAEPADRVGCDDLRELVELAGDGGRLATVERERPIVLSLLETRHPPDWESGPADPTSLTPSGDGAAEAVVRVTRPGRYVAWLGGSFRGRVEIEVDGRTVGDERQHLNYSPGQYVPFGTVALEPGRHRVAVRYSGADLHPGSAGDAVGQFGERIDGPFAIGPLVLATETADKEVRSVPASDVRSLCGRRLDWVAALAG